MAAERKEDKDYSAEFLLKEYERIHTLWMDENRQAEQRVNFFLTLASAAAGAIVLILQLSTAPSDVIYGAILAVLIVLLLFGFMILNRLNARNVQARAYRRSLAEIQGYFAKRDSEVAVYIETQKKIYAHREYRRKLAETVINWLSGGLRNTLILGNGLVCGGITCVALVATGHGVAVVVVWTVLTIVSSTGLLYAYSRFIGKRLPIWPYY